MNKKFLVLIMMVSISSCGLFIRRDANDISLKLTTDLAENKGNLIRLGVVGTSNLKYSGERCARQSDFAFTYATPRKRPEDRKWESDLRGPFKIKKEDLFLIHNNKKIFSSKMFLGDSKFNVINSNSIAYSNYSKHSGQYVTFPLPCTKLLDPNTKLVISKIYKDDKVIKENIEFSFVKTNQNKGYSIWLE